MKKRTKYDKNEIFDCGDYYEMYLYDAFSNEVARTKIDKDDFEKIKDFKWHMNSRGYVGSTSMGVTMMLLHRIIMEVKKGGYVDHINHDTLDNRKQNLRLCTNQQNSRNSKVKGHYWNKEKKKWEVRIMVDRKSIFCGYFNDKQLAIKARRQAEQKYFGEFAFNY